MLILTNVFHTRCNTTDTSMPFIILFFLALFTCWCETHIPRKVSKIKDFYEFTRCRQHTTSTCTVWQKLVDCHALFHAVAFCLKHCQISCKLLGLQEIGFHTFHAVIQKSSAVLSGVRLSLWIQNDQIRFFCNIIEVPSAHHYPQEKCSLWCHSSLHSLLPLPLPPVWSPRRSPALQQPLYICLTFRFRCRDQRPLCLWYLRCTLWPFDIKISAPLEFGWKKENGVILKRSSRSLIK